MSMQTREQMLLDLERKAYLDAIAQARAEGERAGQIAMREMAAKIASEYNCWDYLAKKPDGSWGPGSPYDQGQLNAAQMITAGIMLLKVEGE